MADFRQRTDLYVEGDDDQHSIVHLLKLHGFQLDAPSRDVEIRPTGGRPKLLRTVAPAILAATDRAVGFVIDADDDAGDTWSAIRDRIVKVSGTEVGIPQLCRPAASFTASRT